MQTRVRVPKEYHTDVAAKLNNVSPKALQFQFAVKTALRTCDVSHSDFMRAFDTFNLSASISDGEKVRIFANVVQKKGKKGTAGHVNNRTVEKRVKFVKAVMVRRVHVNCAWLRCTRTVCVCAVRF